MSDSLHQFQPPAKWWFSHSPCTGWSWPVGLQSRRFRTLTWPDPCRSHCKCQYSPALTRQFEADTHKHLVHNTYTTRLAVKLLSPRNEMFLNTRLILTGLSADWMISTLFTRSGSMATKLTSRSPCLYSRANMFILSATQCVSPGWHRRRCCATRRTRRSTTANGLCSVAFGEFARCAVDVLRPQISTRWQ